MGIVTQASREHRTLKKKGLRPASILWSMFMLCEHRTLKKKGLRLLSGVLVSVLFW